MSTFVITNKQTRRAHSNVSVRNLKSTRQMWETTFIQAKWSPAPDQLLKAEVRFLRDLSQFLSLGPLLPLPPPGVILLQSPAPVGFSLAPRQDNSLCHNPCNLQFHLQFYSI